MTGIAILAKLCLHYSRIETRMFLKFGLTTFSWLGLKVSGKAGGQAAYSAIGEKYGGLFQGISPIIPPGDTQCSLLVGTSLHKRRLAASSPACSTSLTQ